MNWPWRKEKKLGKQYEKFPDLIERKKNLFKELFPGMDEKSINLRIICSLVTAANEGSIRDIHLAQYLSVSDDIPLNVTVADIFGIIEQYHPDLRNPISRAILENILHLFDKKLIDTVNHNT